MQRAERREYGPADLELRDGSPLFAGFPKRLKIWMSHGDNVLDLPPGFHLTGATGNSLSAAEDSARRIFAVQFHPEVRHTERGTEILRNFVFEICGAQPNWSGASFIADTVEAIRKQVGQERALCALSGGVDSAVAAALVHRAIGDRLTNVFVDNGVLRKGEFHETDRAAGAARGAEGDRRGRFRAVPGAACGSDRPEEKRKRIGAEFIAVFADQARSCAISARCASWCRARSIPT